MTHQEVGLAAHTTELWPFMRMTTQQFPEHGLCIRDEPFVRVLSGLILEQDVLQPVGEGGIPMKLIYRTLVKTFVSPLYIKCQAQGSIVRPIPYRAVR